MGEVITIKTFGERLREARKSVNLNAKQVGELVGVSENYVYMIERGERAPSLKLLMKMSKIYSNKNIIDDFINRKELLEDWLEENKNDYIHMKISDILNKDPKASEYFLKIINDYDKTTNDNE